MAALAMLLGGRPIQGQADSSLVQVTRTAAFPARTIVGFVYNARSGEPLAGAQVPSRNLSDGTLSDSAGHFNFLVQRPGNLKLAAEYIGFERARFHQCRVFRPSPLHVWLVPLRE